MRCHYESTNSKDACKLLCNQDRNCKGFTMLVGIFCQLATTSSPCPNGGIGPWNTQNKGNLDPEATCFMQPSKFGGCFIKNAQGTHLLLVISLYV